MNEEEPSSLETLLKIKKNSNQQEEKKKKIEPCFRHSGFALKKLGKQDMMVENNALHPNSVTQLEEIEQFNADVGRQSENNLNNNSMSNGHLNYSSKGFDEHHTSMKFKSRPPTAIHNSSSQSNMFMKRILSAKSTAFSGFTQSNKKEVYMTQKQREEVEEITTKHIKQDLVDERDVFIKNHSEIRLMLHPKLTKEGLPQSENLWAPGSNFQKNLSKSNQLSSIRAMENQTIIKVPSIGPMKKLQMRTQSAATLKSVSGTVGFGVSTKNPNPFIKTENIVMPSKKNLDHEMGTRTSLSHAENEKRKTQNQLDAGFDECRSKPIVRTSGPYLTEKDKEQIIEREQKKYIIGDPLFHTGAVTGYKMMNNILFNDVYNPPSKHQFREFNPQKWVSRNAFFL